MDKVYVGAAYYPELWDESEVDKDICRCKELHINTLRIGEFAWSKMEPREKEFHFDWLHRVVDKLYAAGISTVLCTPTCTPPRWLMRKYPETRMVGNDGVRTEVSSRCHPCKTSEIMREKNRLIVTEMAKAFGAHPGVIGWQIDNEIFPYGDGCYCPQCIGAFRKYLENKYGTIASLNRAWGMDRWSLDYDSFDDIQPPYPKEWKHPSLRAAWWRFQCEQIYSYVAEQAQILHAHTTAPVGTDMMVHNRLSYYRTNDCLDVVQFNHYNTAADLPKTAFSYDFLRPIKDRPFWVTETQVGWNGSEVAESGYRPQGNCYVNTWLPIAKGAEMNLYWLYRAHRSGHELAHGALLSTAARPYRVSEEVTKAATEFGRCADWLSATSVKSKIAIHYSATAAQNFEYAPMLKNFDYRTAVADWFYDAFRHYNVDVIDTPHDLDEYDVILSPFLSTVDENGLKERMTAWVQNGGTWIVGPMSDIMDADISKYTDRPFSFLEEFAGVYTKYQLPLKNDVLKATWRDGTECAVSEYFDAYVTADSESLAKYAGSEFDGLSVITRRNVGKGCVILLGSVPSHKDLRKLVPLPPIAEASGSVTLVRRSGKDGGIIALETENKEGYIVCKGKYKDLLTEKTVCGKVGVNPHQVLVLREIK